MNQISTIVTLYKTPIKMLENLKVYKKFQLYIFEQEGNKQNINRLKDVLNFKFKYFHNDKNIGLSKSSNFLMSKVKSKFCLFTQTDVVITEKDILGLKKIFNSKKDIIFVTPNFKRNNKKKKIEFTNKINAACILIDMKKIKELGFFDEDYFLYWEDIQLMKKINQSKYKMVIANNIYANHLVSKSTESSNKTAFIRNKNFIYGELVFDYKQKKLRIIKIVRKLFQNLYLFFFHIIFFQLKKAFINLSKIIGIFKFIKFLFIKKF